VEISEDGTVTGSIDSAGLDDVEPKTDEAKAQLDTLKAQRDEGQQQAAEDAEQASQGEKAPGGVQSEPAEGVTTEAPDVVDEADRDALRAEYSNLTGNEPDGRWGVERLRSEIDAYNEG
jgi:hypothetical protein